MLTSQFRKLVRNVTVWPLRVVLLANGLQLHSYCCILERYLRHANAAPSFSSGTEVQDDAEGLVTGPLQECPTGNGAMLSAAFAKVLGKKPRKADGILGVRNTLLFVGDAHFTTLL